MQLTVEGVEQNAAMPEKNACTARCKQRSGKGLRKPSYSLHGLHRATDTLGRDTRGGQLFQFAQPRQAVKGVLCRRLDEPDSLPKL